MLAASAEAGATVVAIGPYTNLFPLKALRSGLLRAAGVVVMGGHVRPSKPGFPTCGVDDDFNVQQDRMAAAIVLERCDPVVVPIGVTIEVLLRAAISPGFAPLDRSDASWQTRPLARARDHRTRALSASFERLPDDLLNFQHDPLACAVAYRWNGVEIEEIPPVLELRDDRLWMTERDGAPTLRTVTGVDAPRFEETWLQAVERASTPVAT